MGKAKHYANVAAIHRVSRDFSFSCLRALIFLSLIVICSVAPAGVGEARSDDSALILTGNQLTKSVAFYNKDEFGPIKAVTKFWNSGIGPLNRTRRFQISFYDRIEIGVPKEEFLRTIMVLDREKPPGDDEDIPFQDQTPVYDWNSADCSLQKVMLIKKNDSVYLIVAYRSDSDESKDITSQAQPSPLLIKLFKLVESNSSYFLRISEHESSKPVCDASDVYKEMKIIANSSLK